MKHVIYVKGDRKRLADTLAAVDEAALEKWGGGLTVTRVVVTLTEAEQGVDLQRWASDHLGVVVAVTPYAETLLASDKEDAIATQPGLFV